MIETVMERVGTVTAYHRKAEDHSGDKDNSDGEGGYGGTIHGYCCMRSSKPLTPLQSSMQLYSCYHLL